MTIENPSPIETPALDYSGGVLGPVETNKDAKMWGMLCHLSSLVGLVIPGGFFVGPSLFDHVTPEMSRAKSR